jgi:hypothetical protein
MTTSKRAWVHFSDEMMEWCERQVEDLIAHYRKGDPLQAMPWTCELMSEQELQRWLASCEEAGRAIDIETCELGSWHAWDCDRYGIRERLGELPEEDMDQVSRNLYVRSPESNGWIFEGDLPTEKSKALRNRIHAASRVDSEPLRTGGDQRE